MHLTDKVVTAKVTANSYVMTEHTRSRIKKLVYKTMHPHGMHHYIYDAETDKHTEDDSDSDSDTELPKPSDN